MRYILMVTSLLYFIFSCRHTEGKDDPELTLVKEVLKKETIVGDIQLPENYFRPKTSVNSFTEFLRSQHLKKDRLVYLYNGRLKANQSAQYAVLDISVGNKDLQQCADAVMRLRAEYLYALHKYSEIAFTTGTGKVLNYKQWLQGKTNSRETFMKYLEYVFNYCGTASLPYSLKQKPLQQMQPGDVLLKPGFPGHAVIVMDMAVNNDGKKLFMLAQSYMPAQSIHILKNPSLEDVSPWYELANNSTIETPEWTFYSNQLYGWK